MNTSFNVQTLDEQYYYKHVQNGRVNRPYTACYRCIVNSNGKYDLEDIIRGNNKNNRNLLIEYDMDGREIAKHDITILRQKYLTILSREKYDLYKTNN